MRRMITPCALALATLMAAAVSGQERHVKVDLTSVGESGVSGFVELTALARGTSVHVVAHGLRPGATYGAFDYESADCTPPHQLLGEITSNPGGSGEMVRTIDDDLDLVGSVSVRAGPEYGTLLACARVH
jgi:Cu/Zn superoxide dismutase